MTTATPTTPARLASSIVAPTPLSIVPGNLPVCTLDAVCAVEAAYPAASDLVVSGTDHGRTFMTIAWTAFPAFGTKGHSQRTRPT